VDPRRSDRVSRTRNLTTSAPTFKLAGVLLTAADALWVFGRKPVSETAIQQEMEPRQAGADFGPRVARPGSRAGEGQGRIG